MTCWLAGQAGSSAEARRLEGWAGPSKATLKMPADTASAAAIEGESQRTRGEAPTGSAAETARCKQRRVRFADTAHEKAHGMMAPASQAPSHNRHAHPGGTMVSSNKAETIAALVERKRKLGIELTADQLRAASHHADDARRPGRLRGATATGIADGNERARSVSGGAAHARQGDGTGGLTRRAEPSGPQLDKDGARRILQDAHCACSHARQGKATQHTLLQSVASMRTTPSRRDA